MTYLISQVFGLAGTVLNFCIYRQESHKRLLIYKLSTDIAFMIHYCLLSAWSGMAVSMLASIRALVFMCFEKKGQIPRWVVLLFMGITALSGVVTWQGPRTLLTTSVAILAVFSFAQKSPRVTRILAIPISGSMLIYNFIIGSVSGMLNEGLTLLSAATKLMADCSPRTEEKNQLSSEG